MSPYRLNEYRSKIQFTSSAEMPHLIYQACLATGTPSNTVYCQHALVDRLAYDLVLDPDLLRSHLPRPRGPAAHLFDPAHHTMVRTVVITEHHTGGSFRIGPANTDEQVR